MLTRQRQLGAQIAPGITLFPSLFFFKSSFHNQRPID